MIKPIAIFLNILPSFIMALKKQMLHVCSQILFKITTFMHGLPIFSSHGNNISHFRNGFLHAFSPSKRITLLDRDTNGYK
jgi:hypothetical protein